MVKIAITEDEREYRELLKKYLERYQQETGRTMELDFYTDGDGLVEAYQMQYDIILMDIQMRFMDGISAAKEIRKKDPEVVIIFITNMDQYATKGYEVDALDYILKPVDYFMFSQKLERAILRMQNRNAKYIMIDIKGGMKKIDLNQVLYIESQGHKILFHTLSECIQAGGTMKEYEEGLEKYDFSRCNKGYLVNLKYVDGISDGCAEVGEERLAIGRTRKNQFMEALTNYMSKVVK